MTDEELGAELAPDETPENQLKLVAMLDKMGKRAGYEHLIQVGREVQLYDAGLAPCPPGVIVYRPHHHGRRVKRS